MLGVLSMAVLIASTSAAVEEFSVNIVNNNYLYNPYMPEDTATFINPQNRIQLYNPTLINGDSVSFDSSYIVPIEPTTSHDVCGTENGISLSNGVDTYCGIENFAVKAMELEGSENIHHVQFLIRFRPVRSTKGLLLVIPVYKIPHQQQSANEDQLKDWASQTHLGLTSAVTSEQLEDILEGQPIALEFGWMQELLTHRLRKTVVRHPQLDTYVSRPVVLPEDDINKIIRCVNQIIARA